VYVYAELGPRISKGSNASRKYVLESGKSPELQSEHGEVQRGVKSPYKYVEMQRTLFCGQTS
jgi:hypothetical protein